MHIASYILYFRGGNFHLKVGGAKSSGNACDPMLGDLKKKGHNSTDFLTEKIAVLSDITIYD